jgi:hypothetical protein
MSSDECGVFGRGAAPKRIEGVDENAGVDNGISGKGASEDPSRMGGSSHIAALRPLTQQSEQAAANQANVKATRPEQSRTRPATVTARKLFEANSSRMVHHLLCVPAPRERLPLCTVKRIFQLGVYFDLTDDFMQHRLEGANRRPTKKQPLIYHPGALPISAVFRLRYVHTLMRKWAASETYDRHVP